MSALLRSTGIQTQNLQLDENPAVRRGSVMYVIASCMFLPLLENDIIFNTALNYLIL